MRWANIPADPNVGIGALANPETQYITIRRVRTLDYGETIGTGYQVALVSGLGGSRLRWYGLSDCGNVYATPDEALIAMRVHRRYLPGQPAFRYLALADHEIVTDLNPRGYI